MNSHKDFDNLIPTSFEGTIIQPQPPKGSDCCEFHDRDDKFDFYIGSPDYGHDHVYGPIYSPEEKLHPVFDYSIDRWIWKKRTEKSKYEWYKERGWT